MTNSSLSRDIVSYQSCRIRWTGPLGTQQNLPFVFGLHGRRDARRSTWGISTEPGWSGPMGETEGKGCHCSPLRYAVSASNPPGSQIASEREHARVPDPPPLLFLGRHPCRRLPAFASCGPTPKTTGTTKTLPLTLGWPFFLIPHYCHHLLPLAPWYLLCTSLVSTHMFLISEIHSDCVSSGTLED